MGQFDVEIPALHRGRTLVTETHEQITAETTKITGTVQDMLSGAWTGPAASDYATGWHEWREGAAEVLQGLDLMGQAMAATLSEYVERDQIHRAAFQRTGSGLGDGGSSLNV